jgi:serine/threonine-protein kinase
MSDVSAHPIPPPEAGDGATAAPNGAAAAEPVAAPDAPALAPPAETAPAPPAAPRRSRGRAATILAVAVLVAGAAAAALLVVGRHAQVAVPSVVGRDQATAARLAEEAGFRVRVERVQSSQPSGLVVGQSPRPRARADKHSTVVLKLSAGPASTSVPQLQRQSPPAAEQALREAGLTFTVVRRPSTAVPAGQVASVSPPALSQIPRGAQVTLAVSTGPARVRMPSLIGQREAAAQQRLARAGFQLIVVRQESSQPAGQVIAQQPPARAAQRRGATAQITVATAPPRVSVPDVTALDLESSVTTLSGLGLQIAFRDRTARAGQRPDTIVSQDPPARTQLTRGGIVTLTVLRR